MKKIILSAIAICAFGFANAQENIIKANPLALLGGTDMVSFEHKLGDNTSILVGAGISNFKIGGAEYSNTGAEVQYRYYFDEALTGFYAGGQVGYSSGKVEIDSYNFVNFTTTTLDTKFSAFKLGAKGGYQWIWDSGFSLDLNIGMAYNNFSYKSSAAEFSTLKASGVLPNFGFGLGYAF
jgi:hypothetical protein